jgi:peptidoglycan hydrolase CwlO-like protein
LLSVVTLGSVAPAGLLLGLRSSPALADPISDKQAEAAQLTAEINDLGTKIEALSQQYDAAQQDVQELAAQLTLVRSQVATDKARVKSVDGRLRVEAVNAYTEGGPVPGGASLTEDVLQGHMGQAEVRSGFVATVATQEQNTVDSLHLAERALSSKEVALRQDEQAAEAAVAQVQSAQQAAEQTINQEESLLSSVKGQLAQLVVAQEQAEAAAAAAAQRAAAAAAAAQQPAPTTSPPGASTSAAPSSFQACVAFRESTDGTLSSNIYGFLQSTWSSLGLPGSPYTAPASEQTQAFQTLYASDGTAPWAPYDGC